MIWFIFIWSWLLIGMTTMTAVKFFYRKENGFMPRLKELPVLILFVIVWPAIWYFEIRDGS